jgi:hypothetical protein
MVTQSAEPAAKKAVDAPAADDSKKKGKK